MTQLVQFLARNGLNTVNGTGAPIGFVNGLPLGIGNFLAVDSVSAIDHYHMGLPFTANSRLAVNTTDPVDYYGSGGAPFTASGKLAISTEVGFSVLGGVVFSADGKLTTGGFVPPEVSRTFVTFDSVSTTFANIVSPKTFSGDYDWEVDVYFTGQRMRPFGNTANFKSRILIESTGQIIWTPSNDAGDVGISVPAGNLPLQKLNKIRVERRGAVGRILINGSLALTNAVSTLPAIVNVLGRNSTSYGDGVYANVKFTDLATPANSAEFAIDGTTEGGLLTYVNFVAADFEEFTFETGTGWIGQEVVTNGTFDTDTNWTKQAGWTISGGTANANLAGTSSLFQTSGLFTNYRYRVSFEVVSISAGQVRLVYDATLDTGIKTAVGVYTNIVLPLGSTANRLLIRGDAFIGSVDNVSGKRVLELP